MTKPSVLKRMKNCLFCGLNQEQSASPVNLPKKENPKSRSNSKSESIIILLLFLMTLSDICELGKDFSLKNKIRQILIQFK